MRDQNQAVARFPAGLLLLLLAGLCGFGAAPFAQAQTVAALQDTTCARDRAGALNCTANDFTVGATLANGPDSPPSCVAGSTVEVEVDLSLTSNSPSRYDVGFFVGQSGNSPTSAGGQCSVATFPESPFPWVDLDLQAGDSCGDFLGPSQSATPRIQNVKLICQGDATTGELLVPYTLVYSQNGNAVCASAADVVPGTSSKCQAGTARVSTFVVNGYIDVTKQTLPDGDTTSFGFTASGSVTPAPTTFNLTDNNTQRVTMAINGSARQLTVDENVPAHWRSTISCSSGTVDTSGEANGTLVATLQNSSPNAACTVTNTKRSRITIQKNVGGRVVAADQFTVAVSGAGSSTLTNTSDAAVTAAAAGIATTGTGTGVTATNTFFATPGQALTLTDAMAVGSSSLLSQYDTRLTCTNAFTGSGATGSLPSNQATSSFSLTPAPGDDITCTYSNTPQPRLSLQKAIALPGRNAGSDQFALTISGTGGPASVTTTGAGTAVTSAAATLTGTAGAAYTLSEAAAGTTNLALYDSSISCSNANAGSGTVLPSGSGTSFGVTPANNDDISCTITNGRKSASLRLAKAWSNAAVNDTASLSSTGLINNASLNSIANAASETDTGATVTVYAGETATLAEVLDGGNSGQYSASAWSCSGGTLTGNSLAIDAADAGTTITCTITNTRATRTVTVAKSLTPSGDSGKFTLQINGSPVAIDVGNGGSGSTAGVPVGSTVDVAEIAGTGTVLADYVSSLSCSGVSGVSGTTAGSFTLPDNDVTCTFTNTRNTATLTLAKTVVNDNGGTTPATAWTLSATGPTPISGTTGSAAVTNATVDLGTYTLAESGPGDYLQTGLTCSGAADTNPNDGLTLAAGEAVSCQFTNDDQTASLTLAKSASVEDSNGNTVTGDAGDTITYTFSATNTGTVALAPVTVTDPLLPGLGCTIASLAPSATASCAATNNTYVITATDVTAGSVENTATATGDAPGTMTDPAATDTATTSTAATPTASLTLAKSASVADTNGNLVTGDAGDTITYTFNATNTGTVTLAPVTVTDPLLPTLGCTLASLAPGATAACAATNNTSVITAADVTAGNVVNTATATGDAPGTIVDPTATDTATTPTAATPTASLTLAKSASVADTNGNLVTGDAGDTITYTFSATNTGTVTLAPVTVTDPLLPTLGCTLASLAPGATASCAATNNTYVITASDVTAGNVVNTATATGDAPGTIVDPTATDSATVTTAATPTASLTLAKSASVADTNGNLVIGDADDVITYTFSATNTGTVALAPVTVTDPLLPTLGCTLASLAPGATASCATTNNTYVITAADVTAGNVVNTATATGDAPGTIVDPTTTDTATTSTAETPTASVVLTKSASVTDTNGNTVTGDAGDTITYTFSMENTGTVTLAPVTVTDPLLPSLTCTIASLAPSATASCAATNNTYVIQTSDVGGVTNTATATGDAPGTIPDPSDSDTASTPEVATPVASLTLAKSASVADTNGNLVTGDAGDTITYTFSATNTGTVTLAPVTITDPLLPSLSCTIASLAPSATASCAATNNSYVITAADVTAGNVVNTATATGDAPGTIVDPTATDSATVTTAATPTASLTLTKSASVADTNGNLVTGDAGDTITYTFSVENTGTVTLAPVTVADPLLPTLDCTSASLAAGATASCAATNNTYVITATDVTAGNVVNTATATGDAPGTMTDPTATDTATTPTSATPTASLVLTKSASVADTNGNLVTGDAGDTITYTFSATNTGTVTLTPVTVADPLLPTLDCAIASLASGATASCTPANNTYVITAADVTAGNVVNTATATGDAPGTITDPTATDTATTPTAATPTASLTLAKSASVADTNGNLVTGDADDTITYTFSATNTGTVALAPVTVTDPLLPSLSCTLASLAPSATASCTPANNTYVITGADVTAGNVVNTATATGDAPGTITDPTATDTATTPTAATPTASLTLVKNASVADTNGNQVIGDADDTITYTFSATNTGTVTLAPVTVTDPLLPSLSCTIASLAPAATAACVATNNTYVITATDVTAGNVVNTATATGDAPGTITDPIATDTATTSTAATPTASLVLTKSASVADTNGNLVTGDAGDTITYAFSVENTGTVTLAPVTVSDPLLPSLSCTIANLAPSATASCTATNNTYVITAADVTAGSVMNTATATGDAPGTITDPTTTDTATTSTAATPVASLTLVKSASVADTNGNLVTGDAGDTITYSFSVENTGTVTLAPVTVADPLLPTLGCTLASLASGATAACAATNNTYVITAADVTAGNVVNTATATGDAPGTITDPTATDSATVTTAATPTASLTLVKNASVADTNGNLVTGDAGDTITYTFSATNTGTVTLTPVTVTDPLLPTLGCTIASLAPAATVSCAATNNTYVITAADVTAGNVVNTATATGDAPGSIVDPTATDTVTTSTSATPTASLTLAKSASVADTNGNLVTGDAGDVISYTFSATNTGTVALAPVTVTDPLLPTLGCTLASLAPGATAACAATNNTYVITAADVTAGNVVNTATATGDAPGSIVDPTATDTVTTSTAATPTASLALTKSASVADTNGNLATGDAGDTITYTFSAENTGSVTLTPVTVTDPLLPSLGCTIASLAPGATASCAATGNTYVIQVSDVGGVTNTATATGDAPGTIPDPSDSDSVSTPEVATPTASLTLDKSASVADTNGNLATGDAGDTITYTFSATNTGTVTLAPVTVTDPLLPSLGCTIASLASGATASCAATNNTYVITAANVTAGNVVNTATATGDAPGTITDPTATDTATTSTAATPTASLTLAKSASVADTNGNLVTGDAGDTITYTFSATNTGTVTLAPVTVTDPLLPSLGCTLASLAPGATAPCTATNNTYVITTADVTAGNVVNTATATGDAPGTITDPTATDTATTSTAATPTASVVLTKSASVADTNGNLVTGDAGDTVTYTFSATNTGTVTLAPVTVTDSLLPSLGCTIANLAPGATAACAATNNTYVITAADVTAGNVVNTATATGDAPGSIVDPTATDTVTTSTSATPTASLTLAKSASVTDTNGNTVTGDAGDTITYTFSATNTGTVTLAPVTVTDPLLPALGCTLASLAPGATAACAATNNTYVITAADVTAGNVVNTATATGDAPGSIVDPTATDTVTTSTAATPTASLTLAKSASVADTNGNLVTGDAGDTITYTFSATNTGTVTLAPVTVTDPLLPSLGCTLASLAPGATAACAPTNNTYVITAADVTAGSVVNTATATGDAPGSIVDPTATDSATVTTAATPTASLTLAKSASVADTNGNLVTGDAGDTITYSFSVQNTGTVALAPVTVTDPLLPSLGCTIASLAPGATASCAATGNTYVIQVSDVGGVTNTATATGDAPGTIPDPSDSDSVSTPEVAAPTASLTLAKSASVADTNGNLVTGDAGDTITYTFSATNTGTVTLAPVTVTDPLLPSLACTIASLAPAATASCTATNNTYVITGADVTAGNVINTATATGDAPGTITDPTTTDTATTSTAATPVASLTLVKSASVADTNGNLVTGDAGDTITYSFSVENTGTVTLAPVTVTDPLLPTLGCTLASLASGATAACAATNNTYVITAADVTAGNVVNTATATGDAPGTITDPTATDTATTSTSATPTASLTLAKSASVTDTNGNLVTGDAGDTITYTFSATNTGTVALAPVTVADPLLPSLSCTLASLAPSATASCTPANNTYVITAADVTAGNVVNTATATGDAPGTIADPTTTDTATTPTVATPVASLTLDKSASVADTNGNLVTGDAGDTITYTFSATNTGTVALASVTVTDPLLPSLACTIASLAPAATASCAATNNTYVITAADVTAGNVVNTATVTGDAPGTITDPTATGIATTSTAATPTASVVLTKSASVTDTNGNTVTGDAGDVITYTFSVENTGTVTLAPVTITDPLLPSLSCTLVSLAPGATASCAATGNTYTIQAGDVPAGVTNTATATGDAPGTIADPSDSDTVTTPTAATPVVSLSVVKTVPTNADDDGSGSVTINDVLTYTITATNTGDITLTGVVVSDPQLTPSSINCASLAPGATCVLTGTHTVVQADVDAGAIVNTATADSAQTSSTSSNTVTTSVVAVSAIDPMLLRLAKQAAQREVKSGDLVRYTVTVDNVGASAATNATLVDTPPAGFTYVDGSLVVDDDNDAGMLTGTHPLRISGIDIAVGGRATIVYYLRVGAGVGKGAHLNSVSAIGPNGDPISNVATAEVDMAGDPLLDDSLILGTVFDDRDGDGRQDEGERGIPGVRIASVEGLIMETDAYGRYHLAGVSAGDWSRGRNFILKVDAATLPPGSQFTTENPRVRRITPGIPVRFDFGVKLPAGEIGPGKSETDIELGEVLFEAGSATVKPEYAPLFATIADKLRGYDGGRVTITAQAEAESLAFARASAVQAELARQLSPELAAKTQIDVSVDTQTLVSLGAAIRLGEVLFDTDKATVKPAYRDLIREIAATLNREGHGVIGVIGRADPRGANAYNVQLGLRRAKAVFEAIAAELTPEVRQKVRVDITDDPNAAVGVGDR